MSLSLRAAALVSVVLAATVTWAAGPPRHSKQMTPQLAAKMGLAGVPPLSDEGGRHVGAFTPVWYEDDFNPGFASYLDRRMMAAFRVPFW